MGKYLLLTAKKYNSWLQAQGEWEWDVTSWRIYSDGSYRMILTFKKFDKENLKIRKKQRRQSGRIPKDQFEILLNQLKIDNWGEADRNDFVYDGTMWEIRQYSCTGEVIGSSGDTNFICGRDRPLDKIVACLPEPEENLFEWKEKE